MPDSPDDDYGATVINSDTGKCIKPRPHIIPNPFLNLSDLKKDTESNPLEREKLEGEWMPLEGPSPFDEDKKLDK